MEMLLQRVKLDLCSRERWAVLCLYCDVTNGLEIKKALVEQRILNATILDAAKVRHKRKYKRALRRHLL